jgi:signal transduction histidine kinase
MIQCAGSENFKALFDDTEVVGIKSGLGLHLIRDLAKAIDCEIVVESKLGEGTTFTLII